MSDVIKGAKKLLDGATPAPWELYGGEIHHIQHTPEQCTSIRCDHRWPVLSESWGESAAVAAEDEDLALMAAAPELAQALAEETWEYSYQELRGDEWETAFNDVTHLEEWWPKKSDVDWIVEEARKHGYVCRLVRRRVSPIYMAELI